MKIQLSWTSTSVALTADKKAPPVSAGGFLLGFIQDERTVPDLRVLGGKDSSHRGMESDLEGPAWSGPTRLGRAGHQLAEPHQS